MGALIRPKSKQNLVEKLVEENYTKPDLKKPIVDPNVKIESIKNEPFKKMEGDVSPDTDAVKDGVNKVIKKGKASTIMTGMFGDTSKANTYSKSLLGG